MVRAMMFGLPAFSTSWFQRKLTREHGQLARAHVCGNRSQHPSTSELGRGHNLTAMVERRGFGRHTEALRRLEARAGEVANADGDGRRLSS